MSRSRGKRQNVERAHSNGSTNSQFNSPMVDGCNDYGKFINPNTWTGQGVYSVPPSKYDREHPIYTMLYQNTMRMALSRWDYPGLEAHEIEEIERAFFYGYPIGCVGTDRDLVNDSPDGGLFFGQPVQGIGKINWYGRYDNLQIQSKFTAQKLTSKDGKYAIGNFTAATWRGERPSVRSIDYWARRMIPEVVNAYEAWQVAVESRKAAGIVYAKDEREANLFRQAFRGVRSNMPFVVMTSSTRVGEQPQQNAFNLGTAGIITEYHDNFQNTLSLYIDMVLGANNATSDKKERSLEAEVNLLQSVPKYLAHDSLLARQRFLDKINEFSGRNLTVRDSYKGMMENEESEVGNDGAVENAEVS